MDRFVSAIRDSVRNKNWFAALFMSLAMPDICAQTEYDEAKYNIGKYYQGWYERYLNESYVFDDGAGGEVGFFAKDCWLFRCSCLHAGLPPESKRRISEFAFRPPAEVPGIEIKVALFQHQDKLTIQIDLFAENICKAVEKWYSDMKSNPEVMSKINNLIYIDDRHNENLISYE